MVRTHCSFLGPDDLSQILGGTLWRSWIADRALLNAGTRQTPHEGPLRKEEGDDHRKGGERGRGESDVLGNRAVLGRGQGRERSS